MVSTNKTKPKIKNTEGVKEAVLTTNKIKPREFSFVPRAFPTVKKLQTRRITGMLTTSDLEKISRNWKRLALMAKVKALKAEKAKAVVAKVASSEPIPEPEPEAQIDVPKKKYSRKKKKAEE
jgi:hypothetical protein